MYDGDRMIVECSWCKQFLKEKAPLENKDVTHTICEPCMKKLTKKNPPIDWTTDSAYHGGQTRLVGPLVQTIAEQGGVYSLFQRTAKGVKKVKRFSTKIEALAVAGIDAAKALTGKNPGEAWHMGKMEEAEYSEKHVKKPSLKDFYHGKATAHFESALTERAGKRVKKNPIAVFGLGNPPKEIHATVEGIVYRRCLEVKAEKTGAWQKGLWKHPFSKQSKVCILALDNGDLLLHSMAGIRLWKKG